MITLILRRIAMTAKHKIMIEIDDNIYRQILQAHMLIKTRNPEVSMSKLIQMYIELGIKAAEGDIPYSFQK